MANGKALYGDNWTAVELDQLARFHDRGLTVDQICDRTGRLPRQISERLKIVTNRAGRFYH